MRALAVWLLLLGALSAHLPSRQGRPFASLVAQYATASALAQRDTGLEWLGLSALVRSKSQPGGRRGGGPTGSQLPTTYEGAALPFSTDGQIRYNAAANPAVEDPFPGTIMNTYDGQAGPPVGAANGFRNVACANSTEAQTALAAAINGDLLQLTAGVRYIINFGQLPALTAYIGIETANLTGAPARGTRCTAAHNASLAIIETTGGNNSYCVDILTGGRGRCWFRFVKFECRSTTSSTDVLVRLGSLTATSPNDLAQRVVFERILVNVDPAVNAVKSFLRAEAHFVGLLDSTVREIFHGINSPDSRCISQTMSNGPVKLINNELNGASQSFLTGGAGFTGGVTPTGERPSDWEVRRNNLTKSIARKGASYAGVPFTVKVNAEFKDMQRALLVGNIFGPCWVSGQTGFGFSHTNYSINGQFEYCQDLVYAYNQMLDTESGVQQYQENSTAETQARVVITHLVIDRFNLLNPPGSGRTIQCTMGNPTYMGKHVYKFITAYNTNATHMFIYQRGSGQSQMMTELVWQKTRMLRGAFGFWDGGVGQEGTTAINDCAPVRTFEHVIMQSANAGGTYPANVIKNATLADTFQDAPNGLLALPTVPPGVDYHGYNDAGLDPGANHAAVSARTAGCITGVWP